MHQLGVDDTLCFKVGKYEADVGVIGIRIIHSIIKGLHTAPVLEYADAVDYEKWSGVALQRTHYSLRHRFRLYRFARRDPCLDGIKTMCVRVVDVGIVWSLGIDCRTQVIFVCPNVLAVGRSHLQVQQLVDSTRDVKWNSDGRCHGLILERCLPLGLKRNLNIRQGNGDIHIRGFLL